MQTSIKKWGNSLAIRIPSNISKTLNLKDNKIILDKKQDLASLCQNIDKNNLNIDSQWGDNAVGKEW